MRTSSRMSGAALLAVVAAAMALPAFAQQELPAAGQAPPEANGPGAPPQGTPPPGSPAGTQPQAAPVAPARSAVVTANVNLRSGPDTDAEILATIPAGSRVQVTDCSEVVMWNGKSGFAIARNLDIGGAHQVRRYRTQPGYYGGPPAVYEAGPPVVYGPPVYYAPPPVVYAPGYYYGPRYYGGYGPRYYGWGRRW